MTLQEWDELLTWMEARWPDLSWTAVTCKALFEDLDRYDAAEVWDAVYRIYQNGETYPKPAQVVSMVRELTAHTRRADAQGLPALPDGSERDFDVKAWLQNVHGVSSMWGLVVKTHAQEVRHGIQVKGHDRAICGLCRAHRKPPAAQPEETMIDPNDLVSVLAEVMGGDDAG